MTNGSKANVKKYVVSSDIFLLLGFWANQRNFVIPQESFFEGLRKEFEIFILKIFPEVDIVPEKELSEGLERIIRRSSIMPVSLDRTYCVMNNHLEVTRIYDNKKGKSVGLGKRADAPSLFSQFKNLKKSGVKEIILVDDVIFSGEGMKKIVKAMNNIGISVSKICVGIGIGDGVKELQKMGIEVDCVRYYEDVVDEVCERDFYPGVPFSGRLVYGSENTHMPYILPFGDIGRWASIPSQWQKPFSQFCLKQTINLFEEIEQLSGKEVYCQDIAQHVILLPRNGIRYVDALKRIVL